eukprot:1788064-Rhodomonas_salina.1
MPYPLVKQELACGRRSSWGPGKASRVWTAHTNSCSHVSSATFGQEELINSAGGVVDEGVSKRDGGSVAAEVTGQGEGILVVYCTSRPAALLCCGTGRGWTHVAREGSRQGRASGGAVDSHLEPKPQ